MTLHRITIRSNPKILYFFGLSAVMTAVTVLLFLYAGIVPGIIAGGVAVFFLYHIVRHLQSCLSHLIRTTENGITFQFKINDMQTIAWDEVTFAGTFQEEGKNRYSLFIYREEDDTFLTVPPEFTDFASLHTIIKEHTGEKFLTIELEKDETIESRLKKLLKLDNSQETEEGNRPETSEKDLDK